MAAADWPPPPTYVLPIELPEEELERLNAEFSPIWLEWFLLLAQVLTAAGAGGGGIQHNLLSGLDGGQAGEYYHLTADQHDELTTAKPANQLYAGPTSGADAVPAFRAGVVADIAFTVTQRLLGRNTAAAGKGEEVTVSQVLDWIGSTRGSILYRGASGWAVLAPGTAGFAFLSNGAGADPSWQEIDTEPSADDAHWEPVSNMNPASPELLFDATTGDVVMGWVS